MRKKVEWLATGGSDIVTVCLKPPFVCTDLVVVHTVVHSRAEVLVLVRVGGVVVCSVLFVLVQNA